MHQLPLLESQDDYEYSQERVRTRRAEIRSGIDEIFARCLLVAAEITSALGEIGFRLLASRQVSFRCSCSHVRMVDNLQPIFKRGPVHLFDPDQQALDIKCEYCKAAYRVTREELDRAPNPLH